MKRKVTSLLRASRASTFMALVVLLAVPAALEAAAAPAAPARQRTPSHPYLRNWYDGQRNLPLAACSAGTLTEQDLFLFSLMRREANPALFRSWEESRGARERGKLTDDIGQALEDLALTLLLADRAGDRLVSPTDAKFIRYLKYPVYQMVWIEKVLRPTLQVQPIDLIKHYHDHRAEFYRAESVRVRHIFREIPPTASIAERDAVEKGMNDLRTRAVAGEDFVELARAHSQAPSAVRGGELPSFPRGVFVEDFENHAFALEPGQFSPVFLGRGGFYLIQCIEKLPERQVPFDAVQNELREAVERKALVYLYDHRLARMIRRGRHIPRYGRFLDLLPTEELLTIGDYQITKREFLHVFPHVVTPPLEIDLGAVSRTSVEILRGELVAQEIERLGLDRDPLLVAADRLARRIWQSRQTLHDAMAVPLTFSESQVERYYEINRVRLGYQPQWHVLRIGAAVQNPYLRHPSQLQALAAELRAHFEQTVRQFQEAFREERARATEGLILAGDSSSTLITAASIPEDETSTAAARFQRHMVPRLQSLRILTEASTTDYQFEITDLGFCSYRNEGIYPYVKDLREGGISAISALPQGGFACYFVARHIPGATVAYSENRTHARQQYIASLQAEALDRLRNELASKMALRITLPEIGSKEQ